MTEHAAIPKYMTDSWSEFTSGAYQKRVLDCASCFQMDFQPNRLPFIFAGNLHDHSTRKILTFGLAPHASVAEFQPQSLQEWYSWRVNYFNARAIPHRIHCYFARLCWGILGEDTPTPETHAEWLHRHGYLTFDLLPFYVKDWKIPDWNNTQVVDIALEHFRRCLDLIRDHEVAFAIFSGRAWIDVLLNLSTVAEFNKVFRLNMVTGKRYHTHQIYVGELKVHGRRINAAIIGGLLHLIRGFAYDEVLTLGDHIKKQWELGAP
jgi:hypothetical protein